MQGKSTGVRSGSGMGTRRASAAEWRAAGVLALGLLTWGTAAWAATGPETPQAGTPLVGSFAVTETTAQIMARQAAAASQPQAAPTLFFLGRADTSGKTVDSVGEGLIQGPATGSQLPKVVGGRGPLAPQAIGVTAEGPGSTTNFCGTPPDTMGAVGPTQFIIAVNCNIVSYNKATGAADGVLATTPNVFFTSVRSSSTTDPHIRYDRISRRWFVVMIDVTFPNNRVLLGVSNTATITNSTVWSFFFFQSANGTHTNCLADYPTPGIDANAIYIGVNQFCGASLGTASYAGSDGYVVQKTSVLGGGPIHVTAFQSVADGYTPQGVDNTDPAATEGYFLGGSVGFWNKINLFRVSNPGGLTPTLAAVPITTANQGQPIPQPHQGNTGGANGRLDASDNRPFAAVLRDGRLWTAMDVGTTVSGTVCQGVAAGSADRDAVFWWELQGIPTGSTPSIRQAGVVCDTAATNPAFFSYGTVMVSGQGHAAIGYTIAGAATLTSTGTSGRLAGDALNTLQSINVYGPGASPYNPAFDSGAGNGFRRWGDYSFTSLDPCDDMTMWTIQEYANPTNQYRERFAQLEAPPPATPASASPSSVAPGLTSVSVVVTGTSSSGSGFYDTPSSMSAETCRLRIAGAVTGGVTVNSVTYTDPTHVTLNLNTVGAVAGLQTVTITNPDGQTASAAVLTIGTVPPAPTASNNGPICAGQTLQLSASTIASATYAWTGPNGFTSSLQNPSIVGATAAASGTYSVTATVGSLTSLPGTTVATVNPVPGTPTITVDPTVGAGSPNRTASVAFHVGSSYLWTIGNGTITSGQGTATITFTAGVPGTLTLSVTETNASGCAGSAGTANVTVTAAGHSIQYYTVTPCRRLDTRSGPPLAPGGTLTVPLTAGACGIPTTAKSVSLNVTVTGAVAQGHLILYPSTAPRPLASTINFVAGQNRANNAILALANDGSGTVSVFNSSTGTVHVVIDVNGYFE